jgi:hypothetical protein
MDKVVEERVIERQRKDIIKISDLSNGELLQEYEDRAFRDGSICAIYHPRLEKRVKDPSVGWIREEILKRLGE